LLADQLRDEHSWLRVQTHCGGGSFKSQMKKADKSGAQFALLLGEDEVANGTVTVKDLRGEDGQSTMPVAELYDWLAQKTF
jgi:histidyl-tRNA synthetase